ncbi:serine hydrolase domain-containing protein [Leadbetterella byssophila]|uniref:serine hydrolase domain-containing protein n=1 Tax=Leadbetterella byssophila TaxID=316068 RepID=UPI0039A0FF26
MKKLLLFFLFSWQTLSAQSNLKAGIDPGVSPERLKRIDKMLQEAVEQKEIPGAVALVARKGKIVYLKAFGEASPQTPMKPDHIFRIASQTKAITATALMMLWEEGKFRLDDPVHKFIPEFKNMGVLATFSEKDSSFTTTPAKSPITIRQLLNHTSGIGYGIIDDSTFRKIFQKHNIKDIFSAEPISTKENILNLAKMPLHFHPGEKYKYSEGLDVAGYLIEVLSGKPLDVFLKERIFDPLGMNDTYFYLPDSKAKRLVSIYTKENNQFKVYNDSTYFDPLYPIRGAKTLFSGGAGLSSTATDYAKFLQLFLNKGMHNGKPLLSKTTVDLIMQDHIGLLWDNRNEHFGLAFSVVNEKGQATGGLGSKGTFSWGGYFNTQYFADPQEQVIGIILKQTSGLSGDNTSWKFKHLVFQTLIAE